MALTQTEQRMLARHATLASVELIAARDGDPAEMLEEIRRVLELSVPTEREVEDAEHVGAATA